ncbi:unnamed protein product [Microthlaspi erraticum]|uniref:Oxidoreductase FAD/NAD(P)-binding domain-containing protein n=1 Tax=Microthlaspi erraticum TaxID=1685480 RepID=A0A6D2HH87_9BRAS|nr:unnamed protein product [Microthlaspi erraticum]
MEISLTVRQRVCVRRAVYYDPETGKEDPSKNGVCSNFLCDSKPGDKIQISGPSGKVWPTRIVFLYDDEFSKYLKDHPENFRFDKALSREEKNKKGGKMYVQDKIEEYIVMRSSSFWTMELIFTSVGVKV